MTTQRDWSEVERRIKQDPSKIEALVQMERQGELPSPAAEVVRSIAIAEPKGFIERLQVAGVQHKAKMRLVASACESQVRAIEQKLKAGEKISVEQTRIRLHETLEELKQQHLSNIQALDAQTILQAGELLEDFTARIFERVAHVQDRVDIPPSAKTALAEFLVARWKQFAEKVTKATEG